MYDGLTEADMESAIEAMLFVTDTPVSTITLADMLEVEPTLVADACAKLQQTLASDDRGIQLTEVAGGWRLATNARYHNLLENYVLSWDTRKLSQAAMEVLAIVAYTQPVTRATIANVRGVNSDSSINWLLDKGLLREAGTEDTPGNPVLYATSKSFLEKFGLRSVEDLPDLVDFAPDEQTRTLIRTRLSAARGYIPSSEDERFAAEQQLEDALQNAIAETFGTVEKIDFDDLQFDE